LHVISDAAIGLIVFTIGAQLHLASLRGQGATALKITLVQAVAVFTLVGLGTLACGVGVVPALLLGALAVAAAAPSTFVIIQEYNCDGPMTRLLLIIVALNDILTLVLFRVVVAAGLTLNGGESSLAAIAGVLTYQILGSLVAGAVLGSILGWITQHEENPSELFVITLTSILLVVGGARLFGLSPLLCNLALGIAVGNVAPRSRGLIDSVRHTDPPVYISFFVLAGAELEVGVLRAAGLAGAVYIVLRAVGKYVGGHLGSHWAGASPTIRANMGLALLPQAGIVIGLGSTLPRYFPEHAALVNALVLAGVFVYEFLGLLALRFAFKRAGEIGRME
jgi:Kef-type K+ transport system membrane component KefB